MTTRSPVARALLPVAAALVAVLALSACGDSGSPAASPSTTEAADATDPAEICDELTPEAVGSAAGVEVTGVKQSTGTGSVDEVDYHRRGCTYELVDDGEVGVDALTRPGGTSFTSTDFAELLAISADRRPGDHPHEVVDGLGVGAFFRASMLGNELIVDTGNQVLSIDGEVADEPMPRDTLVAIATEAVAVLG